MFGRSTMLSLKQHLILETRSKYLVEERIQREAYQVWQENRRPDGEQVKDTLDGRMKVKEIHWLHARSNLGIEAQIEANMRYWFILLNNQ